MGNKQNVTVLLPAYNAEQYVSEAIESILNQSYDDFELLVINDGSTDRTKDIILSFQDARIKYLENEKNIGLVETLNRGINLIQTKYIIRADADDICMPQRFQKQIDFMDANPNVGACGTWFDNFDSANIKSGGRYLPTDLEIKLKHLYQMHISHGTAIIRTSVLKKNSLQYDGTFKHAEDYDFFNRVGDVSLLANIQEVLYMVRQHNESVSKKFNEEQESNSLKVKKRIFEGIGCAGVQESDIKLYETLLHQNYSMVADDGASVSKLLEKLFASNGKSETFPFESFRKHLSYIWLNYCYVNAKKIDNPWNTFFSTSFTLSSDLSPMEKIKLSLKSLW